MNAWDKEVELLVEALVALRDCDNLDVKEIATNALEKTEIIARRQLNEAVAKGAAKSTISNYQHKLRKLAYFKVGKQAGKIIAVYPQRTEDKFLRETK